MKAMRDTILSAAGWCCLLAFAWTWYSGRARNAVDYAESLLEPLPHGTPIAATDRKHALWSGWWTAKGASRTTSATNPDVLFRSNEEGHRCDIELSAFALPVDGRAAQRVSLALNGHAFSQPMLLTVDGNYRATNVGNLVAGVNRLAFRLPDAGQASIVDERIAALGVKSIAFECEAR